MRLTLAVLLPLVELGACAPAPPPPPKAPVEEPPPPPPPKCEALSEGCIAKVGQRAAIHPLEWTIEPPAGWKYAVESEFTIALADVAALAVSTFEPGADNKPSTVKANTAKRAATIARLSEKLAVVRSKKLVFPAKPHKSSKVHGVNVALYQFDGAKRSNESGPLLVFVAQPVPDRTLIGIAFVAERDTTSADAAILKAIDSLAPAAAEDAARPATE